MMTKFKVGDRVKLVNIKAPIGGEYHSNGSNTVGNVGSVAAIRPDGFGDGIDGYYINWDGGTENSYWEGNLSKLLLNMRNK